MVLGRSVSFRFLGKMSSSLTENVHITSVAHILTRKRRDSFHCESFQLSCEFLFFFLSCILVIFQLVFPVVNSFHISFPSFLLFPPGNGEVDPQRDTGYTCEWKRKVSPRDPLLLCACFPQVHMSGSCFITKGSSSLQVQHGWAPLSITVDDPRSSYCCSVFLSSLFPLF